MRKRIVGTLVAATLAVAACGGDDAGTSGNGSGADADATAGSEAGNAEASSNGVARLAYDLTAASRGGFTWDPSASKSLTTDVGIYHWVYGSLMRPTAEGSLEPELAKTVNVLDGTTIKVTLRPDLTLSDGTPLTPEDIKAALEANLAKTDSTAFDPSFYSLESIDVEGNTLTLHVPDGTAAGWYDQNIAGLESTIVPPDTDFSSPVGAGPFVIESYVPGESLTLTKNEQYWNADEIDLAGLEVVNAPSGQTGMSALNADQVDWARVEYSQVDGVAGDLEVIATSDPEKLSQLQLCKAEPPLDDAQVRDALATAIDREAINEALFGGVGAPAWDLWPEGHSLHNEELTDRYAYNPEKARSLLDDAGYGDGFNIDVIPINGGNVPEMVQVIQQQWAEIGVTMNIIQSSNFVQDFMVSHQAPIGAIPQAAYGRGKLANYIGNSQSNVCGYENEKLAELEAQLKTVTDDSPKGEQLWAEIQSVIAEETVNIPIVFQPSTYSFDPQALGGYELVPYAIPVPDVWELHATQS